MPYGVPTAPTTAAVPPPPYKGGECLTEFPLHRQWRNAFRGPIALTTAAALPLPCRGGVRGGVTNFKQKPPQKVVPTAWNKCSRPWNESGTVLLTAMKPGFLDVLARPLPTLNRIAYTAQPSVGQLVKPQCRQCKQILEMFSCACACAHTLLYGYRLTSTPRPSTRLVRVKESLTSGCFDVTRS